MTSPVHHDGFGACIFEVANHTLALRLESVREIVPMAALSRPPSMPSLLEGVLNLRGTSIPVLRVALLLGLPQQPLELHTPLVVVRDEPVALALLVERVTGIVAVSAGVLAPTSKSNSFNGCVEGVLPSAGTTVHLLSLDRLLLEKERRTLAEFQATETRRLRQVQQAS